MASRLKIMFIVQGEGRGHFTQAIAMSEILIEAGHTLSVVMVGQVNNREIPEFFTKKINAPLLTYNSPEYVTDTHNKGIHLGKSVIKAMLNVSVYVKSIEQIHLTIQQYQPDVIINFFEVLAGMYTLMYKNTTPIVCVGHQYLMHHPQFEFPKGNTLKKMAAKLFVNLTATGAKKRIALSLYQLPDYPQKNIMVSPPLLRKEIKTAPEPAEDFLLCYVLNSGYAADIQQWHKNNPTQQTECFYDRKDAPDTEQISETLTYHKLNDKKFINYLKKSKGVVTSAGFETIAEAMYHGKPVMAVPTAGHYDQEVNAHEAKRAGAGIVSEKYDIQQLIAYIPSHNTDTESYKNWVHRSAEIILKEIEQHSVR